jgi:hypothetical protein
VLITSVITGRGGDGRLVVVCNALVAAEEERVDRRAITARSEWIGIAMRAKILLAETREHILRILGRNEVLRLHMEHAIMTERIYILTHADAVHLWLLLEGGEAIHHRKRVLAVVTLDHWLLASECAEAANLRRVGRAEAAVTIQRRQALMCVIVAVAGAAVVVHGLLASVEVLARAIAGGESAHRSRVIESYLRTRIITVDAQTGPLLGPWRAVHYLVLIIRTVIVGTMSVALAEAWMVSTTTTQHAAVVNVLLSKRRPWTLGN